MKLRSLLLCLSLAAAAVTAQAQNLLKLGEATTTGIYIKDLRTGKVLAEENSKTAMTPASVMKSIVTASVLSLCGADTCFTTDVALSGAVENGICTGNLIIRGTADPTVESEYFEENRGFCDSIAAALKKHGISRIEGDIEIIQNLSDAGPNLHWEVEDIAWPYGAALEGFNWRDNIVEVNLSTGTTRPEAPGLELCVLPGDDDDVVRGIYSNRVYIYRKPGGKPYSFKISVPDPAAVFTSQMRRTLAQAGIETGEKPAAADSAATVIYRHRSPAFGKIMKSLMVRSDNLFAEGMLRSLAPGKSRRQAIKRMKKLWDDRGIPTKCTTITDGSGLARNNRLSPRFIASVLEWMSKSPMAEEYASYFPRAGKDGTLKGFLAKTPLAGQIVLKTGSVGGVQCYAGYKLDKDKRPTHVVVIMVNSFFGTRTTVRKASENLLKRLFIK